ncbi:restriction endonuclease subunit S [Paenarthrobacter nitroguajacolicus]|uniref:restriction endonuclease subunit S n=1 Tax=Paenarthrobacter nitroguajacolicus TaxID=211146 RepID=UPI00285C24BE|nr:restriction endonuclease subunit S [Paenarthrobacter nitroguajacolicus]MDR6640755.1 type I restriction enzyme S subunit [Paenarthrobacter nitroguajacolicus]
MSPIFGDVLSQGNKTERISDPSRELFVTLKLNGNGAIKRRIGEGKTPQPFSGYRVREGQFIYSRIDARNGAFAIVPPELDGAVVSKDFPVFDLDRQRIDPQFLIRYVSTDQFVDEIRSLSFGATNRQRVKEEVFLKLPLFLPPINRQRRIAAILDKADELRAKRRKAIARLDALTQSIFHSMFGDPTRDSKWGSARLDDLGRWQSGGTPSRSVPAYFSGTIPWYSSGELGERRLGASAERINQAALSNSSAKMIPPGALLLGMYDTAALKSGITSVPSACNQAIAFSKLNDRVVTDYVYYAIQIGRSHFMRLQRGVRQKNLNLSMIRALRVPLPPIELQQAFATRVAAVERLKETHRKHLAELDALFASLQSRAFKGEL